MASSLATPSAVSFGAVTGTVYSLHVPHLRAIAQHLGLDISGPYIRKDDLLLLCRDKLRTCPNCSQCAGPCDPARHLFEVNLSSNQPVNDAPLSAPASFAADMDMDTSLPGPSVLPARDLLGVNSMTFDNIPLITSSADFVLDHNHSRQPPAQAASVQPANNVSHQCCNSASQFWR